MLAGKRILSVRVNNEKLALSAKIPW